MTDEAKRSKAEQGAEGSRLRGSLRDVLAAAGMPSGPASRRSLPGDADGQAENGSDPLADLPQTRVVRGLMGPPPRTQRVRGRLDVDRGQFHQDPVVGWLVVVGGPGLGAFRPIFEGNNTVGRAANQRIPLDFGDDAISAEEQIYIRYDSVDRSFLLVPNMAKTNIVAVNDKKPTAAVTLSAMDLITMGRTQLCFVPFCGPEFDWAELPDTKR